jgi:hypothetical protein
MDLVKAIEKTIEFLKEHQGDPVYERKLLSGTDIHFEFMKPGHAWHEYYMVRRREIFDNQIDQSTISLETEKHSNDDSAMETLGVATVYGTKETALSVVGHGTSQSSYGEEESKASRSIPSSRADEMRRLDRLQRIKELFRQKQRKDSDEGVEPVQVQEQDTAADADMTEVVDGVVARPPRSMSRSRSPPTRSQSPDAPFLRKRTRLHGDE